MAATNRNIDADGALLASARAGAEGGPQQRAAQCSELGPAAELGDGAYELLSAGRASALVEGLAERICELLAVQEPQRMLVLCAGAADRALLERALLERSASARSPAGALPEALTVEELCSELLGVRATIAGQLDGPRRISDAARIALPTDAFGAGAGRPIGTSEQRARVQALVADLAGIDMLKLSELQPAALARGLEEPDRRLSERAHRLGRSMLAYEDALRARNLIDASDLLLQAGAALSESAQLRDRLRSRHSALMVLLVQRPSPALCALLAELAGAIGGGLIAAGPSAGMMVRGCLSGTGPRRTPPAGSVGAAKRKRKARYDFRRLEDPRGQALHVAEYVAALLAAPQRLPQCGIHIAVASLRREGAMLAAALKERAISARAICAPAPMQSAAARDLLTWLAFISDADATDPAMRLLSRAPWALRDSELARVARLARRRPGDAVSALQAATAATQLQGHARERLAALLALREELLGVAGGSSLGALIGAIIDRGRLREESRSPGQEPGRAAAAELEAIEHLAHELVQLWPERSTLELAELIARAGAEGIAVAQRHEPAAASAGAEVLLRALHGGQMECEHLIVCGAAEQVALALPDEARGSLAIGNAEIFEAALELRSAVAGNGQAGMPDWPPQAQEQLADLIAGARQSVTFVYCRTDEAGSRLRPWPVTEALRADCGCDWLAGAGLSDTLPAPADRRVGLRIAEGRAKRRLIEEADRIGARLGELKLDSDFDLAGGVVALFELLKVKALDAQVADLDAESALRDLNARLSAAATPLQRELLESSQLDGELLQALGSAGDGAGRAQSPSTAGSADELSLGSLIPRHGEGVALSASDLWLYRTCPLRYRYARLLRIPSEPTPQQRFGIAVHQALERFHERYLGDRQGELGAEAATVLLRLLDHAWRRGGMSESGSDREWLGRAREALRLYHRRLSHRRGQTAWVERPFSFTIGPHRIRGRIDRVDLLEDGSYELIDYKTGRARSQEQLAGDLQLSLYSLAARRSWNLTASSLDYHYVLDDLVVSVPPEDEEVRDRRVSDQVQAVAEGILALRFPARPSFNACSGCDFLAICPAAES